MAEPDAKAVPRLRRFLSPAFLPPPLSPLFRTAPGARVAARSASGRPPEPGLAQSPFFAPFAYRSGMTGPVPCLERGSGA